MRVIPEPTHTLPSGKKKEHFFSVGGSWVFTNSVELQGQKWGNSSVRPRRPVDHHLIVESQWIIHKECRIEWVLCLIVIHILDDHSKMYQVQIVFVVNFCSFQNVLQSSMFVKISVIFPLSFENGLIEEILDEVMKQRGKNTEMVLIIHNYWIYLIVLIIHTGTCVSFRCCGSLMPEPTRLVQNGVLPPRNYWIPFSCHHAQSAYP